MTQKRLLIVHHGALGDVVVTFPAIARLKQRFSSIGVLFQGMLGKLAVELKVADNWFDLEAAAFAVLYTESVSPAMQRFFETYDSIILFSRSFKLQETISKTTGKKVYLIPPRPKVGQRVHVCQHILSALVACELIDDTNNGHNYIHSSVILKGTGDRKNSPLKILIHPGSGSRKKNWSIFNFIKTAEILESKRIQTEFILGPADDFLAKFLSVSKRADKKVHMINDLKKLVLILKKADGFIGNDSGVGHLASWLNLPTLAIFGPSDPQRWHPAGRTVRIIRPDLDCLPCFEVNDAGCESMECLSRTTPEMVAEAFCELAGKNG